jgi:serine/threonine-protein kinase HipA
MDSLKNKGAISQKEGGLESARSCQACGCQQGGRLHEKGKESIQLDTLWKMLRVLNITISESSHEEYAERPAVRQARVFVKGVQAGVLEELRRGTEYVFKYLDDYQGDPVSLTMPVKLKEIRFDGFPPFFDGVLPEGIMLDGLLRQKKLDKDDFFGQLVVVGEDLVGAVTVKEMP